MDRVRVDASFPERGLDHHLADALEGVDSDRLPGEVGRPPDRAVTLDEDVLPVVGCRGPLDVARGDRAEANSGGAADHRHDPAQIADVAVAVREREGDVVPALQRPLADLDPLRPEEALLDSEV